MSQEPLPIRLNSGFAQMPTRGYVDDAGIDLYCSAPRDVPPGGFCDVPCEVTIEMPPGVWGLVIGRSSTIRRRGLMVIPGVIDTGYRGAMFQAVFNVSRTIVRVERGDRLAQLILFNNVTARYVPKEVASIDIRPGTRGLNSFGSTGV